MPNQSTQGTDHKDQADGKFDENVVNRDELIKKKQFSGADAEVRENEDASLQDDTYSFDEDNTDNEEFHDIDDDSSDLTEIFEGDDDMQ